MTCKNCENSLRTDYRYCPYCGAKVIRKRITFRNLWYDIIERYFNVDNTFLKTFIAMFTRPEEVISLYISGVRRKYLNPISYLAIALTLSGISLFVLRKIVWSKMDFDLFGTPSFNSDASQKIMEATMDFSSFVFMAYIPVVAFGGFVLFNKRNYFLSEHLVAGIYTLGHFSIASFFVALSWMIFSPETYFKVSFFTIGFMILYSLYVYQRLSLFNWWGFLWRGFFFMLFFLIGLIGISIITNIILILTGTLEFSDLTPQG